MFSCDKKSLEVYCYERIFTDDEIPSAFILRKTYLEGNKRVDSVFFYNKEYQFVSCYRDIYEVDEFGLNKMMESGDDTLMLPYLTIATKKCITFSYNDLVQDAIHSTEYCYLGKEDVKIRDKVYKNAYKFKETEVFSGLYSWVYFNDNFVMIKQTYDTEFDPDVEIVLIDFCSPLH